MAFLLANPVLNPATLLFIWFVLSWQFAVVRLILGAILVFGFAWIANRMSDEPMSFTPSAAAVEDPKRSPLGLVVEFLRVLWWETYTILPGYILVVLLLGAARVWLFSPNLTLGGGNLLTIIGVAVIGTLFVIPTAGEVPIIQTLLKYGLATGPALTLLITLPAISLPTLWIVRSAFPGRILLAVMLAVVGMGIVAGLIGLADPALIGSALVLR